MIKLVFIIIFGIVLAPEWLFLQGVSDLVWNKPTTRPLIYFTWETHNLNKGQPLTSSDR